MAADDGAPILVNNTSRHDAAANQLKRDVINRFSCPDDNSIVVALVRALARENEHKGMRRNLICARPHVPEMESPFSVGCIRETSRRLSALISRQNDNDA